jgi:hypothetical protein
MAARFFTDAAAARSEEVTVVTLPSIDRLVGTEGASADIAIVSVADAEAPGIAQRLFRTSRLRVLIQLSASGEWADIYSDRAPTRRADALDAVELLDQALGLWGSEKDSDGRS